MDAPVVITARGIIIPEWTMKNNSADIPPVSPVKPEGDPEIITLVPYGCARLRITEFPVMDVILMEDVLSLPLQIRTDTEVHGDITEVHRDVFNFALCHSVILCGSL